MTLLKFLDTISLSTSNNAGLGTCIITGLLNLASLAASIYAIAYLVGAGLRAGLGLP